MTQIVRPFVRYARWFSAVFLVASCIWATGYALHGQEQGSVGLPPVAIADPMQLEKATTLVYEKVVPSIAAIFSTDSTSSHGTGTIISPDGLILSHGHGGQTPGTPVKLVFGDGRRATGRYLGVHQPFDLSLIRIDGNSQWPAVEIGSDSKLKFGDICLHAGYPKSYYEEGRPLLFYGGKYRKIAD